MPTNGDMSVGEMEHLLLMGMQIGAATVEVRIDIPPKARNRAKTCIAILLRSTSPKFSVSHYRETCSCIFTVALFTILREWKQSRCPSAIEWIMEM